ncbi:MAG: peptidylprolyl isomerase [Flavobacteriia bacterium]|nr:peptidylprolyl isomerase [Flavobacteriia bacterium]OIP46000.1 MAG: peptidylprolyl isomerase [Flavobacteriaceae bacterium CG2_30_31_66]PIV95860.1 MAG: peptidylprolyl isomerase [Flavobacteriaceae bacterium CG17_big_fil_post_rev_8_21_14_2_50_31_13]PIX13650.1 MAG: peptidylprolyl isomerase [Flavobacteriaceae bacterium CG_4_8_14_3_um_filter_31_8]PIY15345.1 MAG: peptidylprolyl isomerase [Flavobacteriaceae bacterium CG_4_10_14_3_um_filter_31_253]PIZ11112.1 MAG: peptidylprolyl isomerase [Flavobacter
MKKILSLFSLLMLFSCSKKLFNEKWTKEKAPIDFRAKFETTKGDFEIYAKREWSPQGVDRLYSLIKNGFYTDIAIFRVVPNFVAQFGIHNDSIINSKWDKYGVDDEPVLVKNDSMTVSFARGGVKTRTTQIFINLKNNNRLDELDYDSVKGFPVIAKVTKGAENVLNFYDKYGDKLGYQQDSIQKYGNKFIKKNYPKIDFIIKATLLKK